MILRDLIMRWQEGVAIAVVLLGLGAGAFLAVRVKLVVASSSRGLPIFVS